MRVPKVYSELHRIKDDIHAFIDSYWESGVISRGKLYRELTANTDMKEFHCKGLKNQQEALSVFKQVRDYLLQRYGFIGVKDFHHKCRYIFTHKVTRKIGTYDKRYKGFLIGGKEEWLDCKECAKVAEVSYVVSASVKSKRVPVSLRKLFLDNHTNLK